MNSEKLLRTAKSLLEGHPDDLNRVAERLADLLGEQAVPATENDHPDLILALVDGRRLTYEPYMGSWQFFIQGPQEAQDGAI